MKPLVRRETVAGDTPWLVQELVVDRYGVPIVRADTTAWTLTVFDLQQQESVYRQTGAPNAANGTLYDTLQAWNLNNVGFNFEYTLRSDAFDRVGGHTYRVEFKFDMDDTLQGPLYARWDLTIDPVLTGSV